MYRSVHVLIVQTGEIVPFTTANLLFWMLFGPALKYRPHTILINTLNFVTHLSQLFGAPVRLQQCIQRRKSPRILLLPQQQQCIRVYTVTVLGRQVRHQRFRFARKCPGTVFNSFDFDRIGSFTGSLRYQKRRGYSQRLRNSNF